MKFATVAALVATVSAQNDMMVYAECEFEEDCAEYETWAEHYEGADDNDMGALDGTYCSLIEECGTDGYNDDGSWWEIQCIDEMMGATRLAAAASAAVLALYAM